MFGSKQSWSGVVIAAMALGAPLTVHATPSIGGVPRPNPVPPGPPIEVAIPELPLAIAANDGQVVRVDDMNGSNRTLLRGSSNGFAVSGIVSEGSNILTVAAGGLIIRQNLLGGTWVTVPPPVVTGVAYDAQKRLVAVSCDRGQVIRKEADGSLTRFGSKGSGVGQFECPAGVTVDAQGHIYVADLGRIVRIDDMSGAGWTTFGARGAGAGQLNYARGVAVDGRNRIHFVDFFNRRVVRVDDMTGRGWVSYGAELVEPTGVAVDAYSRVYVADAVADKVVRIDDMNGRNRKELRFDRKAPNGLGGPAAVYVFPRTTAAPANIR